MSWPDEIYGEDANKIKILIADDDKIIADILKELIADKERSVYVCHDGLEAIEKIQKEQYDLIIVDLIMPRVGGLDVLKFVKKIHPETIVIIITGYASLETAIAAIKEGAYDYIRKPCKLEEMKIVVDRATDNIRLSRENRKLLEKMQTTSQDAIATCPEEDKAAPKGSITFFSSNQAGLHHLFTNPNSSKMMIEKLNALSALKQNGMLTETEFNEFKKHLLKMMDFKGFQGGPIDG
jgi:YesN/AraC family two-component response regulator